MSLRWQFLYVLVILHLSVSDTLPLLQLWGLSVVRVLAYQVIKILNLGQAVVVQLQLLEIDQANQMINLNNVFETKGQMLDILVLHAFLLLLYVCCLSADSLQAMSLALVGLSVVAANLKRIKALNTSLLR